MPGPAAFFPSPLSVSSSEGKRTAQNARPKPVVGTCRLRRDGLLGRWCLLGIAKLSLALNACAVVANGRFVGFVQDENKDNGMVSL